MDSFIVAITSKTVKIKKTTMKTKNLVLQRGKKTRIKTKNM